MELFFYKKEYFHQREEKKFVLFLTILSKIKGENRSSLQKSENFAKTLVYLRKMS